MRTTRKYLRELYRQSRNEVHESLGTNGAFVILTFKVIVVALGISLLITLRLLHDNNPVYKTVWLIFMSDILGAVVLWLTTPVITVLKMPKLAAERDRKKSLEIKQYQGEQLKLWVDTTTHIHLNTGPDEYIFCLAVSVINGEKQKILDLEAHLASIDWITEESATNVWHHLPYIRKNRLEWEDGVYQIELKPGIDELKKLKIAILNCVTHEFRFTHEDLPRKFPYHQGNALYRTRIKFSGKLEGNPDYKDFYDEKEFICIPEHSVLDFLPNAVRFEGLPEDFREMLKRHMRNES